MARISTGRYSGLMELWFGGNKLADVVVELNGSQHVSGGGNLADEGAGQPVEGSQRWDGWILSGVSYDLRDLFVETLGETFKLRAPDGRETTASFKNDSGSLACGAPFSF